MKALSKHENYRELIWMLAKMDFKLRYQDSYLGYFWALLKPLALFTVLNFVFSSIFARGGGADFYALQLIVGLMLFMFFSEGTNAGMNALRAKSQLVNKIYVPRWTIIVASTVHSALVFLTNLLIIVLFFAWYQFLPSTQAILLFLFFSVVLYIIVLSFSLIAAPLLLRFRDVTMIWEVVLRVMFYATPIIYPLQTLPEKWHQFILLNPVAFIIHFTKESLVNDHYASLTQYSFFLALVGAFFLFSFWAYKKLIKRAAENL